MLSLFLSLLLSPSIAQTSVYEHYGPFVLLQNATSGAIVCQALLQNTQGLIDDGPLYEASGFTFLTPAHCVTRPGQAGLVHDLVLRVSTTDHDNNVRVISASGSQDGRLRGIDIVQQAVSVHVDFHQRYLGSDTSTWGVDEASIRVTKEEDVTLLRNFFNVAKLESVRYPAREVAAGEAIDVVGFDPTAPAAGPSFTRTSPRVATEYGSCSLDTVKWADYEGEEGVTGAPGSGSAVLVGGDLFGIYLGFERCRRAQPEIKCHFALRTESVVSPTIAKRAETSSEALACDLPLRTTPTPSPTPPPPADAVSSDSSESPDSTRWMANGSAVFLILLTVTLLCTQTVVCVLWYRRGNAPKIHSSSLP
jgi:hypothetical protein